MKSYQMKIERFRGGYNVVCKIVVKIPFSKKSTAQKVMLDELRLCDVVHFDPYLYVGSIE